MPSRTWTHTPIESWPVALALLFMACRASPPPVPSDCLTPPDDGPGILLFDAGSQPCPGAAPYCALGSVACTCTPTRSCAAGICYADGGCGPCRSDGDCPLFLACHPDGSCGACSSDADCAPPGVCRLGLCGTACMGDSDCEQLYANLFRLGTADDAGPGGVLFGCRFLPFALPICGNYSSCHACAAGACAPGQRCSNGDCTCADDADCPDGLLCRFGLCEGLCTADVDCGCGRVCQFGLCGQRCASGADCADAGLPDCDLTGHCQTCLGDSECPTGTTCTAIGCRSTTCTGFCFCPIPYPFPGPVSYAPAANCPDAGGDGG